MRTGPKPFMAPKPVCAANPSQKIAPRKEPPVLELEGKKWRVVSVQVAEAGGGWELSRGAGPQTVLL